MSLMALHSYFLSVIQFAGPWWTWKSLWDKCCEEKKLSSSAIELLEHQYHLKCPWVSLGCSSSSPGGQRILTRTRSEVPQMAPDASLQTAERSIPSSRGKVVVGVRVSWGVIAVFNQTILCRCHVNNFMSYPRAASEVWMHREFLLSSPTSPKSKGTSSSHPPQLTCCWQQGRKHLQR